MNTFKSRTQKIVILLFLGCSIPLIAQKQVTSPDGKIKVVVNYDKQITFAVFYDGDRVLKEGTISMTLQDGILGKNPILKKAKKKKVDQKVDIIVPLKNRKVKDHFNSLSLSFKGDYQLEFRAYNNGIAYRFITSKNGDVIVKNEQVDIQFEDNYKLFVAKTSERFSSFEHQYKPVWLQDFSDKNLAGIPLFIDAKKAKLLFAEADLYDYPALFIKGGEGNRMVGWQPNYVEKTAPIVGNWWSDRRLKIAKEGDYIAKTKGTRTFPWRLFAIGEKDTDIATNDLVYLLSRPSKYKDFSWIKPGKTSWEWWHANNIIGVDFESGLNTKTYKYYIDFADKYDLEYMLLDEGWSKSVTDISEPNPDIDLKELIRYGKEKDVEILLWASWLTVENTPTFFDQVREMGVAGVKIDFMDRSDQWMINYYERMAKRAFENQLIVDFHGSITPRGLRRAYPNIISYEGLIGMEQNKVNGTDLPENRMILPFTRNVVGPMDYTPGAMRSVQPKFWHANWNNPMGIGTRAHQMALFVVFESGLQMLADNPSYYYKEHECTEFIAAVPTTWDETIALDGKIGEYYIVAKRKGDEWYLGGITANKERDITIDLSFLKKGYNHQLTLFTDGVNANKNAIDYKKTTRTVTSKDTLTLKMMLNGGFVAKIKLR